MKPTLEQIQSAIQAHGATWVSGETSVSQLSESQQDLKLGVVVPEGERERISLAIAQETPREFVFSGARDWRDKDGKNWITSTKNQGNCGSCVAFATVATLEAQARIQFNKASWSLDLSEADLFFCGAGRKCSQGWYPTHAMGYVKSKGVPEESCFPYVDHDVDCTPCSDRQQRQLKIGKWQEVTNISQRKEYLDKQGPLVACMAVYRDFFSYRDGIYKHVTGDLAGYHAISCVGYNEAEQYWICKNSWGADWGNQGFFKIAYGEADIDTSFAMYGMGEISGSLAPEEDETQEDWAEYVVVEQSFEKDTTTLWAYVNDQWHHKTLSEKQLIGLCSTVNEIDAMQVSCQGSDIVKIKGWKRFSKA